MTLFALNLILAVGWAAVTGSFSLTGLAIGFVLAFFVLRLLKPLWGDTGYFRRTIASVKLVGRFLYELVVSSIKVAHDVITPPILARPGVIKVPLDVRTDAEIAVLANLVSLTPGTLSLDVSPDNRELYVHAMFVDSPQAVRDEIKNGLEKRLLEVTR